MSNTIYDAVIVGGGPAGLAAAVSAHDNGAEKLLILERDSKLGGILLQCIHNGFGLHYFGEELTGTRRFASGASNTKPIRWSFRSIRRKISKARD